MGVVHRVSAYWPLLLPAERVDSGVQLLERHRLALPSGARTPRAHGAERLGDEGDTRLVDEPGEAVVVPVSGELGQALDQAMEVATELPRGRRRGPHQLQGRVDVGSHVSREQFDLVDPCGHSSTSVLSGVSYVVGPSNRTADRMPA